MVSYQVRLSSYLLITRIYQWCDVSSMDFEQQEFRLFFKDKFSNWGYLVDLANDKGIHWAYESLEENNEVYSTEFTLLETLF